MSKTLPVLKTDQELFDASYELGFEIHQFNFTVYHLAFRSDFDQETQNTFMTAFAIYARNLYHFFYDDNPRPGDVIAKHWYRDTPINWKLIRPPVTGTLKTIHQKVSVRAAHILYARVASTDDHWFWIQTHQELKVPLHKFLDTAPPNRLRPGFSNFKQGWAWTDG